MTCYLMASRIRDDQPVGPPPRQISPKLINRVVDQFQSCFLSEVRSKLSGIQHSVLLHAMHLDELAAAHDNVRGTFKHQEAETIRGQLITADNEIATTLISQIEHVFRDCGRLLKQFTGSRWHSAHQQIKIDHAREDKHRMGRLYAWLNEHQSKHHERLPTQRRQAPQPIINANVQRPVVGIPRKRDYLESEFTPESSPERPVKRARPANLAKDGQVMVLDLCSDSDDDPTARNTMNTASRPALGAPGKLHHVKGLAPAAHTKLALSRPMQELRMSQPDDHLAKMAQGIEAAAKGLRQAHHDASTKKDTSNQRTAIINNDVASDILRAMGRHPMLLPLNQKYEDLLSPQTIQKRSRKKTTGARAELQDQLVKDAKNWWKARK